MKKKLLLFLIFMLVFTSTIFAKAALRIRIDQDTAKIYVNGEYLGNAPNDLFLDPGDVKLELVKENDDGSRYYYTENISLVESAPKSIKAVLVYQYSEEYYYKKAINQEGYKKYLELYPNGKYSQEIRQKVNFYDSELDDTYFEEATDLSGYELYIKKFPNGKHITEVTKKYNDSMSLIENDYYKKALNSVGIKESTEYLTKFPKGKYVQEIENKIEEYYYANTSTFKGKEDYLKLYPNGKYAIKVTAKLEIEKSKMTDEEIKKAEKMSQISNNSKVQNNDFLNDGLIGYWSFDNGDARDDSGNGNNGTAYGGVTYVDGVSGKAASFDGKTSYVTIINNLPKTFSISFWINTNNQSRMGKYAYEGDGLIWSDIGGRANDFTIAYLNNTISFFCGASNEKNMIFNKSITKNNWEHIVIKKDSNNSKISILINNMKNEVDYNDSSVLNANSIISFGANILDKRFFNGFIDEVKIYNRALSDTEIKELYEMKK